VAELMADIDNSTYWSETDASNNQAAPNGAPEGWSPASVNDWGRATMGAIKRFWDRINPTLSSTGSAGAYVYTPSNASYPTAYIQGETYSFKANFTSVGGDTLNVNSLGALGIYKQSGSGPIVIAAGDIQSGTQVGCVYDSALNGALGGFQLIFGLSSLSGSSAIAAPNKLVNPFAEIDQANEGSSISLTSGTAAYVVDGWQAYFHNSTAVVTAQRVTDAPTGYSNSAKLTVSTGASVASGDYLMFRLPVEADGLIDTSLGTASAQTLAVSFWVKSSIASYVMSGCIQNFAATRSYPFNVTVSSSATWTKLSVVIPGDTSGTWITSGSAGGLYLCLTAAAGSSFQNTANTWAGGNYYGTSSNTNTILSTSSATFQATGAKLEVSSVATPLVRTSIQQELAACQRYYEKSYDPGSAVGTNVSNASAVLCGPYTSTTASASATIFYRTTKRSDSTVTLYDGVGNSGRISYFLSSAWNNNYGVFGINTQRANGFTFTTGGTANLYGFDWTADSRL
jgi:hypothetical protein